MTQTNTPGPDADSSGPSGFGAGLTTSDRQGASEPSPPVEPEASASPSQDDESSGTEVPAVTDGDAPPARKRRRGSRGGRRRKKAASPDASHPPQDSDSGERDDAHEPDPEDPADMREFAVDDDDDGPRERAEPADERPDAEDGEAPRKARRSRKRRARGGKARSTADGADGADGRSGVYRDDDEREEPTDDDGPAPERAGEPPHGDAAAKKRRRRGKRGGRRRKPADNETALEIEFIPGEDDDLPELLDLPDDTELVQTGSGGRTKAKKSRKKSRSKARSTDADDDEDDDRPMPQPKRTGIILVNAHHPEEVRVAVVEKNKIVDLQMTVPRFSSYVNDIYRGRVVNLESAIGAAFVDFGQGRNGFLHASDVLPAYGDEDWKLEKLLTTQIDSDEFEDDDVEHEASDESDDREDESEDGSDDEGGQRGKASRKKRGKAKQAGRRSGKKAGARSGRVRRPRLPIEKLLQKGQMTVCQITKDAIGDKGPTLTTYISIPGRYLVLMPSLARTGVSRKIEDEKERRRLKRILQSLDIPSGMGVIVRTAGVGKTKADIKRDLEYLLLAWDEFSRRLVSGRNPAPLYQESDVSVRTMRDLFTSTTEKVVVDDEEVYKRMVEFTEKLMPENVDRIELHDNSRPIFHAYGVEQDFEKIFQRRVELPSGGSIVIDQTEALVAIDVNSGRTRDEGADFEDIALKTNLEAAPEIARQIRLRDMGGIIVVDFIDMMRMAGRRQVERAFREYLDDDRARSKVGRISQFGLLELTRQRLGPGLSKLIYDSCPRCRGTGRRRTAISRTHAVMRRLGAALTMKGFSSVEVRTHPDVLQQLKNEHAADLDQMRETSGREIVLSSAPDQMEDSVLRYLRTDGREVRPGGRRKR